jgi:hypothetical protein
MVLPAVDYQELCLSAYGGHATWSAPSASHREGPRSRLPQTESSTSPISVVTVKRSCSCTTIS